MNAFRWEAKGFGQDILKRKWQSQDCIFRTKVMNESPRTGQIFVSK
jgi:hypothetical protein